MRLPYDAHADAAYVELAGPIPDGGVDATVRLDQDRNVDDDAEDRIIGHEFLNAPPIRKCQTNLRNQVVRHVNRKPLAITAAVQGVARMPHSTATRRAVFADARALSQRQRSSGDRRQLADRGVEPTHYLCWSFGHVRVVVYTRTL